MTAADGFRIGLIADTHMPGSVRDLWPQVHEAFGSVDYILHAGDLHVPELIDELHALAPTWAVRGNGDRGVAHPRLDDTWLLELGGVTIAMVHEFPTPRRASPDTIAGKLAALFPGAQPDVVVYGHTHHEEVHRIDDVLFVNPGSPTLPRNQSTRLGTIGVLAIAGGRVDAHLYQLVEDGLTRLGDVTS